MKRFLLTLLVRFLSYITRGQLRVAVQHGGYKFLV